MNSSKPTREPGSFRDPSGFIYQDKGDLFRQINKVYQQKYDHLMTSGLYQELTKDELLIPHSEIKKANLQDLNAYKIIKPTIVPFISYPYEWCFGQLKDAALLTLKIQKNAMRFGMTLKDASAYNIQFYLGKPILIDTLSFDLYKEGEPWIAYRQFCQHFLAPLALMAKVDLRMGTLSEQYLDGIPLDLAAKLLPGKTKWTLGLGTHIHLHSRSQIQHANTLKSSKKLHLSKNQLLGILGSLESTVQSLKIPRQKTAWQDYYDNTNYSKKSFDHKKKTVSDWIIRLKPTSVWDAGANDGTFARLASSNNIPTIASDIDPLAVESSYQQVKANEEKLLLPLIIDLTNPSSSIGWNNSERSSFLNRSRFDLTLCLAFIHHLAISNNLPLSLIVDLFSKHTNNLIIEFVPKNDSNTKRLLQNREDIFANYDQSGFENAFKEYFEIKDTIPIKGSQRILYLMKAKKKLL